MASLPLMKLPVDFRLMIYEHLIVADELIRIVYAQRLHRENLDVSDLSTSMTIWRSPIWTPKVYQNILRVGKEINTEASPLLYSQNIFSFWNYELLDHELERFIKQIGSQAIGLRRLAIYCSPTTIVNHRRFSSKFGTLSTLLATLDVPVKTIDLHLQLGWSEMEGDSDDILRECRKINDRARSLSTVEKIVFGSLRGWRGM
jgi:hypothetical protein